MTSKHGPRLTNLVEMPSQVSSDVGFFDRFAPFFAFCLLLALVWPDGSADTVEGS